jgi:hypothetical protein
LQSKEGIEVQRRTRKSLPIAVAALFVLTSALAAPVGAHAQGGQPDKQRRVLE